ncbi:MAG: SAM-dependent chlorinase/fluorinase [candidate division WOR-3 bacterium]|nr:SAM-dependent chlorinase/fluorinase [candidate division WOR-3 bacterium]
MRIITFASDFGNKDWFVSAVKGEILRINPSVRIIDITHELNPFDIKSAAFVLKMVYRNFPEGTIHLLVVDPGVGSKRKPLAVFSDGYFFVGPDNGVFSYVYKKPLVYEIKTPRGISATFHARDVFGPIAAKISLGIDLEHLGRRINRFKKFPFPEARLKKDKIYGEIIYIDRFGNLLTNIPSEFPLKKIRIEGAGEFKVKKFYAQGKLEKAFGIIGSSNFYEIACFKGDASVKLKIKVGDKVTGILI